ncbi:DENN domain-containing protein 1A/1B/1C like protein, partial [Aduncisulcus paluster]
GRLVCVSSSLSMLSLGIIMLLKLIYPCVWPHVLIPILPASLLHILHMPGPFIIGIHSCDALKGGSGSILTKLDHCIVCNFDNGSVKFFGDPSQKLHSSVSSPSIKRSGGGQKTSISQPTGLPFPIFPSSSISSISSALVRAKRTLKEVQHSSVPFGFPIPGHKDMLFDLYGAVRGIEKAVFSLFVSYRDYMAKSRTSGNPVFLSKSFVESFSPSHRAFLSAFLSSCVGQHFIGERLRLISMTHTEAAVVSVRACPFEQECERVRREAQTSKKGRRKKGDKSKGDSKFLESVSGFFQNVFSRSKGKDGRSHSNKKRIASKDDPFDMNELSCSVGQGNAELSGASIESMYLPPPPPPEAPSRVSKAGENTDFLFSHLPPPPARTVGEKQRPVGEKQRHVSLISHPLAKADPLPLPVPDGATRMQRSLSNPTQGSNERTHSPLLSPLSTQGHPLKNGGKDPSSRGKHARRVSFSMDQTGTTHDVIPGMSPRSKNAPNASPMAEVAAPSTLLYPLALSSSFFNLHSMFTPYIIQEKRRMKKERKEKRKLEEERRRKKNNHSPNYNKKRNSSISAPLVGTTLVDKPKGDEQTTVVQNSAMRCTSLAVPSFDSSSQCHRREDIPPKDVKESERKVEKQEEKSSVPKSADMFDSLFDMIVQDKAIPLIPERERSD